ncbi:MAG: hypothetical protein QOI04_1399 [Verrucomicrobiota bacterium]|jgi:hypothetical protein
MEPSAGQQWFLRKHEGGGVFGPLEFEELARWASAARIAPHDCVSNDQETWTKAPMLPQLGMDWLVEVTTERYYGPTTLGAIQEFIRLGEINGETFVINSCDGTRRQIQEMPELLQSQTVEPTESAAVEPAASGMAVDLQDRIRELEQSLREERRALAEAAERYRELEEKFTALAQERG